MPFTPLGPYFGFVPLPRRFYFILAVMVIAYLVIVEIAKKGFYRWIGGNSGSKTRRTLASSEPSRENLHARS
jgi:hypothetical protein